MVSPVFAFADRLIDEQAALDPCSASMRGIPGYDHLLTDYSPDGFEARADVVRRGLAEIESLPITNDDDRLARDFVTERFATTLFSHDTGEWQRTIRAIAAPASGLRSTFDLMRRDGEEAWTNIAARLHLVPAALDGLRRTYELGRSSGRVAARRQVLAAAVQASTWAERRWFDSLADEAAATSLPATLIAAVREGAELSNAAYGAFATYLRDDYAAGCRGRRRLRTGALRGRRAADARRGPRPRRDVRVGVDGLPPSPRRDPPDLRADPAGRCRSPR